MNPIFVIMAGCWAALLIFGVRAGFGLFLEPMSSTFGWGRDVFALAMAVQNLLWGLGQPFAGMIADRWGAGRVLGFGAVLYAAGVFLMALSTTPGALYGSAGIMVGFGLATASFAVVLAAMGRKVPPEKQSWALGIGTAAGSLGMFTIVPLSGWMIAGIGWQTALMVMAVFALLILPSAFVLKGRPDRPAAGEFDQSLGAALREAFGHSGYRYLVFGFFVCGFHVTFIQVHLPPYLADEGLGVGIASWALALVGLFNVIGSYMAGVLGGRRSKKNLLSLLYLTRAVLIAGFMLVPISPASTLVFAAGMGLLWLSTVPLTSGLVAQIFGPRYMATLFGFVFFSHQVGAFLGVWLGGLFYGLTGSYDAVWWASVALGLFAAVIHLPIDERRVDRLQPA